MSIILESAPHVSIESHEIDSNDIAWYKIVISVESRIWHVSHRYSEFDILNSALKTSIKLPPKKLRPSTEFLSKRQNELEKYLSDIIAFYDCKFPPKFCDFLHFYKYEPNGLVSQLNGLLAKEKCYNFLVKNWA